MSCEGGVGLELAATPAAQVHRCMSSFPLGRCMSSFPLESASSASALGAGGGSAARKEGGSGGAWGSRGILPADRGWKA